MTETPHDAGDDNTGGPGETGSWQAPHADRRHDDIGAPPLPGASVERLAPSNPDLHDTVDLSASNADTLPLTNAEATSVAHESAFVGSHQSYAYDSSNAVAAGGWQAPPATIQRRRGLGAFVAVAVIAAVVGALVSTGAFAVLGRNGTSSASGVADTSNLTVNRYNAATAVTAVAAKATPSVVTINVTSGSSAGTGSGVVLTSDGYIVTNTHVVTLDGASATGKATVTLYNGKILPAKIIGTDPVVDLAVIKVDTTGLTPMTFADSSNINVGDMAVAIGAPLGLSNTVTDGIVSTLNRSISVASSAAPESGDSSSGTQDNNGQGPFSFNDGSGDSTQTTTATISLPVIQTDAPINPGNSGGALLDSKGRLIGVNVAIASSGDSSGSIGVGFSIPSDLVKRVADDIMKSGKTTHGLLGASVADATSDSSATQTGALLESLVSGGAAQKAGLRKGDVITTFNGVDITGATDITAQVRTLAGGASASLTYIRDGRTATADVTLGTLAS